ncbi:MAG TPA: SUMF1/EgtB/PvdO family nonheme iron enzyme [Polyangium sp.]|nr:SUMF1/EgtB/PvdO family nonheme iron enzyme [Polyangium sp.]
MPAATSSPQPAAPPPEPTPRGSRTVHVLVGVSVLACVVASAVGIVKFVAKQDLPLSLALGAIRGIVPRKPTHEWRLVGGKHWQIVAPSAEPTETTDMLEANRGVCPGGMVEVKGTMKVDPSATAAYDGKSVEELQKKTCTKWINRDYPERCAEFDRDQWLTLSKELPTKPMHFCMDRFEYPNRKGDYPVIMVNFHEATELCAEQGKRLCDENEWTFACEGEEAQPYPYGYVRDTEACVIDNKWRPYNERAMQPRDGLAAMNELDRLWQGVPSGSRPRCKSPFGLYDMTGNVDEWTKNVRAWEAHASILKGGYWGPVRTRCRPSTRSHDENHTFYQQGFRCCAAVGTTVEAKSFNADPAVAPLPRELK